MTCPRGSCRNTQCYLCSENCGYEHFNRHGGEDGGKCGLHIDSTALVEKQLMSAEEKMRRKILLEQPDIKEEHLVLPKSPKLAKKDAAGRDKGQAQPNLDRQRHQREAQPAQPAQPVQANKRPPWMPPKAAPDPNREFDPYRIKRYSRQNRMNKVQEQSQDRKSGQAQGQGQGQGRGPIQAQSQVLNRIQAQGRDQTQAQGRGQIQVQGQKQTQTQEQHQAQHQKQHQAPVPRAAANPPNGINHGALRQPSLIPPGPRPGNNSIGNRPGSNAEAIPHGEYSGRSPLDHVRYIWNAVRGSRRRREASPNSATKPPAEGSRINAAGSHNEPRGLQRNQEQMRQEEHSRMQTQTQIQQQQQQQQQMFRFQGIPQLHHGQGNIQAPAPEQLPPCATLFAQGQHNPDVFLPGRFAPQMPAAAEGLRLHRALLPGPPHNTQRQQPPRP